MVGYGQEPPQLVLGEGLRGLERGMLRPDVRCRIVATKPAIEGAQTAQIVDDGSRADVLPEIREVGGDVLWAGATGVATVLLTPGGEAFGAADVELRCLSGASLRYEVVAIVVPDFCPILGRSDAGCSFEQRVLIMPPEDEIVKPLTVV